jgi:hypothetical protein
MFRHSVTVIVIVCALYAPQRVFAQSVNLGGASAVASAEDFATRVLQDPWDMNKRTDFGWFLEGADPPLPYLSNISFASGIFSATTGQNPNLFLLETGIRSAGRIGKTGLNFPIDADTYRLFAIRLNIDGSPQASLGWNRDTLWDGTNTSSNIFNLSPGWRTYLVDLPALGTSGGPIAWGGLIRSLQFSPSYQTQFNLQIDWIRLVNVNPSLCRQVTWSGLGSAVDLYLLDGLGNQTLLAPAVTTNMASASNGCSPAGSGYNLYAGALAPGTYHVLARQVGSTGAFTQSAGTYVVNNPPMLTMTSPSEEGSADDFATTVLGKAWDMTALSDIDQFINVTNQSITSITAETPAGAALGPTNVLWATSTAAQPPLVGDPQVYPFSTRSVNGTRIDPTRYRILTAEFGLPNKARGLALGSIARIVWRVAGEPVESVSDDIIVNSRAGVNVMDKVTLDMADRVVLPIVQGSQIGWVPGTSATPGIDRFRFKPDEFSDPTDFFVKRIKLAALERVNSGSTYTIAWTATKPGLVTLSYDTDRNQLYGGRTPIGSVATSAGAGSFVWTAPGLPLGEYFIYAVINDNLGNSNVTCARWPMIIGRLPPSTPSNTRIQH